MSVGTGGFRAVFFALPPSLQRPDVDVDPLPVCDVGEGMFPVEVVGIDGCGLVDVLSLDTVDLSGEGCTGGVGEDEGIGGGEGMDPEGEAHVIGEDEPLAGLVTVCDFGEILVVGEGILQDSDFLDPVLFDLDLAEPKGLEDFVKGAPVWGGDKIDGVLLGGVDEHGRGLGADGGEETFPRGGTVGDIEVGDLDDQEFFTFQEGVFEDIQGEARDMEGDSFPPRRGGFSRWTGMRARGRRDWSSGSKK